MADKSKTEAPQRAFEPNQTLFNQLRIPFESLEKAEEAMKGFQEGLAELRAKFKVTNFAGVALSSAMNGDKEAEFFIPFFFGDLHAEEAMAAWLLGQATRDRQERIGKLLNFLQHPAKSK